ncbi:hypothetical protein H6F67_23085 [Microcoleus sp. FACHB-1515]|uniref:hypothetical protein n=1 Tax=Cyanophyceae TaxID=3028117 RepID=UPI00168665DE|nr:hypothetical protein [Microcoleus sp. FACHB-1515]MBD2092740.1 hypothetical protein [Microcoleus sp. FACHB-1515]
MSRSKSDSPLRIYRPLPLFADRKQIEEVLRHGSIQELLILPLALGEHCPNWKYAQGVCLGLAEHSDPAVRANACLGLAYIARTKQRLEKHLVKPILLRELRDQIEFRWRIEDAIKDINHYLKWNLANKHEDK